MGHCSDPGDGENHFPNDPDTKNTDNKVHHLDHINSLSHYFEQKKKRKHPKTGSVFGAESETEGLWRVNRF